MSVARRPGSLQQTRTRLQLCDEFHLDAVLLVNYFSNLSSTPAGLYARFWTAMQALLFCQDENSARVLIPLVRGLDIAVMHETEVFSAMRTLMAERFDFLIIDYKDEQTGRVLLKNARSSGNQAALAVAVVNPETGANALRLGADYLVTRPIQPGQAGGVLRLVRSAILRRKVPPNENASKAAAEQMLVPQEVTASAQEPRAAISNAHITTDSNLSKSFAGASVEDSVEDFSGVQASLSSGPIDPESATAKPGLTAITAVSMQTEGGEGRELTPIDKMNLDGEIPAGLAVPASQATPEADNPVEIVSQNAVTKVEKRPARRFLVSLAALGIVLLTMAGFAWHMYTKTA